MKVRVLYNSDKTVSIIHPALKSKRPDETEDKWLKRVFDKATPANLQYEDVDLSELPLTREDRNAWEGEKGKGIFINQEKVVEKKREEEREKAIQQRMREMAIKSLEDNPLLGM